MFSGLVLIGSWPLSAEQGHRPRRYYRQRVPWLPNIVFLDPATQPPSGGEVPSGHQQSGPRLCLLFQQLKEHKMGAVLASD